MNLSDQTRKDLVKRYLIDRVSQWVDGPELCTEGTGGSEGLRRLRELRTELPLEGFVIRQRRHPNPQRDIWQYRIDPYQAPTPLRPAPEPEPVPYTEVPDEPAFTDRVAVSPDGHFSYEGPLKAGEKPKKEDVRYPNEWKFREKPIGLPFGAMTMCPRCKGYVRKPSEKTKRNPKKYEQRFPYGEICYDPTFQLEACRRCDGWGVVPNTVPIPSMELSSP